MEKCSERFLSASSDETECYLYPKRIKIENNQKSMEKEEQQKLEQSIQCVSRYQTSPHEAVERQNNWALEKKGCDTARKTCMREFFHFQTCNHERLPCKVSENKLSSKKWSPENDDLKSRGKDVSMKVCERPLERESLSVWGTVNIHKNLQVLNLPQVQQNVNAAQNSERNGDNELNRNSSITPINRRLFQMESLTHRSGSDKTWKQYQLLQIPILYDTSSVFSHKEHKNIFLKTMCSTADKDDSSNDNGTTSEREKAEHKKPSYIIPTIKRCRSIPPLEIPNFQNCRTSNKINSKMPSTNLKRMDWKDFKGQPSLMQSKLMYDEQKMTEIEAQKLQNDKSNVKSSTIGSELREINYSPNSKQEHSALEDREVPVTYNNIDTEYNELSAENYFKNKILENSDDQKSKIDIYISAKNVENDECVSCIDLKRAKSNNENIGTLHIQMSVPPTIKPLEKKKLDVHCGVHKSSSDTGLHVAESKLCTKETLDFKRYLPKNIVLETSCLCIIVQSFPDREVSCNIFRGKQMFQLKFSFQNLLFRWSRTWTESLHKGMLTHQDDSVTFWFQFRKTLSEQCDAQELVKSILNRNHSSIICVLLAIISSHLKMEQLKAIPSFFKITNALLPPEGKTMRMMKHPLCGRKQGQLISCTGNTLRQNTEFHEENETFSGFVSSEFVESIFCEIHTECWRRYFSRSLGGEQSTFLKRGMQKIGLSKRRYVRKHHILSRQSEGFSTYLRAVRHKDGMKKTILVAKCLILLQGSFDFSSLEKIHSSNTTKMQYQIGGNLRFWRSFPAHTPWKFENANSKCTKQEKKKPSKTFNSSFHAVRLKSFPFIFWENKKHETTGCRNCIKSTNEVTDTMKKYVSTSHHIKADRKECVKLQINHHNLLSKNSFSVFDTYEKIPLSTDSEDFDQIPVAKQDSSVKIKLSEENEVNSSKEVCNLPAKSNDDLILPEQSKTTMEKCNSHLLLDSQTNKPEYCKKIDTYSPHVANKQKIEDQNAYLNVENVFSSSSNVFQSVTVLLNNSSSVSKDRTVSEDEHCRSSSSTDKQKRSVHASIQCPSIWNPTMADACLQETVKFSLHGHTQTDQAGSSEPADLKQCLECVEEQEEINDEQINVTNESQCETVMNDLIMSYSEDESKTFIASEEKLKMHLSVINNGCFEDVKNQYLPIENKITYDFELKRKFDLVLEELHTFHEISKGNENNLCSLETNSNSNYCELSNSKRRDENATSVPQKKICAASPVSGTIEGQNITEYSGSPLKKNLSNENEDQKVSKEYCISRLPSEGLLHSPIAEGYFDADYKKPYIWDPPFLSCSLLKEKGYNLQEEGGYFLSREVMRVQPLKTCKGPIRIGLSKKARPKQLHPYLK